MINILRSELRNKLEIIGFTKIKQINSFNNELFDHLSFKQSQIDQLKEDNSRPMLEIERNKIIIRP